MSIQPGALVNLSDQPQRVYQVVNVDAPSNCAWVRPWPLQARRHSTVAVQLSRLQRSSVDQSLLRKGDALGLKNLNPAG